MTLPANTRRCPTAGLMLVHRRRCWSNIKPALGQCLLFAGSGGQPSAIYSTKGGGPRVVVSTAVFHARVRGSVPGLGGLKETKMFLPHPRVKLSLVGEPP